MVIEETAASRLDRQAEALRQDVVYLAQEVGERNAGQPEALAAALHFIEWRWSACGLAPRRQLFGPDGYSCANLEAELVGSTRPDEIIVLGAHYDSAPGSPGANGSGSAIAALLAMASRLQGHRFARTLRLVAFADAERSRLRHRGLGSRVYAQRARRSGEAIAAAVCLGGIGCRRVCPGSQQGAVGGMLLPRQGDFLALVANRRSRPLLQLAARGFALRCALPTRALLLPSQLPGAWRADPLAFWKEGVPALLLTDTGGWRAPWYRTPDDTPDRLDYAFLSQVVAGIEGLLEEVLEPPA